MCPKVLYTYPAKEMDRVKELADVKVLAGDSEGEIDEEEFKEEIRDAVALGNVRATHTPREVIEAAENLKVISRHGVGYDCVDVEAATEKGILVTHALPYPYTVAEHAVGFLIALARNFVPATSSVKSKKWEVDKMSGSELKNKTLGVVGVGEIGMKVTEMVKKVFDMNVLGYDMEERDKFVEIGGEYTSLETLLENSDYVTLHVPLCEATRNLIDEEEFNMMKDSAALINTARGAVVNEKALVKALKEGTIAGAALDTFVEEPPRKDNPLLGLDDTDNVIFTPHVAGVTHGSTVRLGSSVAEDIVSILKGELPSEDKVVNKEVLESYN